MKQAIFILGIFLSVYSYAQSTFVSNLPCKKQDNMNIFGIVESNGKPVPNVVVSDGYEVTLTDKQGCYYLQSSKRNGYVFITSPGNYSYEVKESLPLFWARLCEDSTQAERHDFHLISTDNQNYAFIGLTDMHLANRYNDHRQLSKKVMPVIRKTIKQLQKDPTTGNQRNVFTLNCGDSSFDTYWYQDGYTIRDFPATLKSIKYPTAMFSVMGNHDNDPATPFGPDVDFLAEVPYRETLGPTYYSFNVGAVHFVMLDNTIYQNHPGKPIAKGIWGKKDYLNGLSQNQMEWLSKDLAFADKNAPIVVCLHDPIFLRNSLDPDDYRWNFHNKQEEQEFINMLLPFSEIHIIDGHTHNNYTYRNDSLRLVEHNLPAICGSWWRTGFRGYDTYTLGRTPQGEKVFHKGHDQFCPDGTPAGFVIFEVSGKSFKWKFQSIYDDADTQFRAFDMNEVKKYASENEGYRKFIESYPNRKDLRKANDNEVWLNVWNWNKRWTVEAFEDGKSIEVKPVLTENPQHVFTYIFFMTVSQGLFTKPDYKKVAHATFFKIKCKSPNSTLTIKATDEFGRVYTQIMKRPKVFFPDTK